LPGDVHRRPDMVVLSSPTARGDGNPDPLNGSGRTGRAFFPSRSKTASACRLDFGAKFRSAAPAWLSTTIEAGFLK